MLDEGGELVGLYTYIQVITMLRRGCGASKTNLTNCTHHIHLVVSGPVFLHGKKHENVPRRVVIVLGHRNINGYC